MNDDGAMRSVTIGGGDVGDPASARSTRHGGVVRRKGGPIGRGLASGGDDGSCWKARVVPAMEA